MIGQAMLLSNVTLLESGSKKFLQLGQEGLEGLFLTQLMGLVIGHGKVGEAWEADQHEVCRTAIIANTTNKLLPMFAVTTSTPHSSTLTQQTLRTIPCKT